ncbi:MAG: alpha/beta hydrolase [Nitrososphaerota archaeon]
MRVNLMVSEGAENRELSSGSTSALEGATTKVYKIVGDIQLQLHIFEPFSYKKGDTHPVIIFFFGGGWRTGNIAQFQEHCKYFASRGMIAIAADYRVKSRHNTSPFDAVADAKSAVRWVRSNAESLGADADRVVASGGSAGGHIAACAGIVKGLDESSEDLTVSSVPNALVLFNPVVDTSRFREWIGERWRDISPIHHVSEGMPPTIIFHGVMDEIVPFIDVAKFAERMMRFGNRCELIAFEGKGHGFFNYARDRRAYVETVAAADRFLASLGYLKGSPTIS